MHRHSRAKHPEDDVHPPLDIHKRRRHEVRQSEVEDPVRRGGQRDRFPAHAQGKEFGRVDPGDGPPGGRVRRDKEIGAGDDRLRGRAADFPALLGDVVEPAGGSCVPVGRHEACVCEHPCSHKQGAYYEGRATAPAVDEEEGEDGHYDIDDILDG